MAHHLGVYSFGLSFEVFSQFEERLPRLFCLCPCREQTASLRHIQVSGNLVLHAKPNAWGGSVFLALFPALGISGR